MDESHKFTVVALGSFSQALRRSCFWACRQAGFIPTKMLVLNSKNAVVVDTIRGRELYVRVVDKNAGRDPSRRTAWTSDPSIFQRNWGSLAHTHIKRMLSDPDLRTRKYVYTLPVALVK